MFVFPLSYSVSGLTNGKMPAELFPTRYRGLCHGISAAFGKLGSVVAQLFLAYINYGHGINYLTIQKWLPYSLLMYRLPIPILISRLLTLNIDSQYSCS